MLQHDDARALKYFADVAQAVGEAHDNLREIMTHFRTRMDPLGLLHALQAHARTAFATAPASNWSSTIAAADLNLSDEQEVQVFHIVQEALANIAKHSMRQAGVAAHRARRRAARVRDRGRWRWAAAPRATSTCDGGARHFGLEIMQRAGPASGRRR